MLNHFKGNPSSIKGWDALRGSEVSASIRKNLDAIENVSNALDEGLDAIDSVEDALQAIEKAKPTWDEIKALFLRGNNFNRKARTEGWYDYHEIHLLNGKRLDSYDPDLGEIVSRKATNFDDIKLSTFENYLREMNNKYAAGTIIRSDKYPDIDGQPLQGDKIIEVPASNQNSSKLAEFEALATLYNTTIRFRVE